MSWCIKSIILLILWSISGTSLIGIFGAINIHFIANSKLQGLSTLLCQGTRVKLTPLTSNLWLLWLVISPLCGSFLWIKSAFFCWFISQELTDSFFFLNSSFEERSSTWARPLRRRSRLNLQGFFPMKHGGQVIESPWDPSIWSFLKRETIHFGRPTSSNFWHIHTSECQPRKWCSRGKWLSHFVIQDKSVSSPNVGNTITDQCCSTVSYCSTRRHWRSSIRWCRMLQSSVSWAKISGQVTSGVWRSSGVWAMTKLGICNGWLMYGWCMVDNGWCWLMYCSYGWYMLIRDVTQTWWLNTCWGRFGLSTSLGRGV